MGQHADLEQTIAAAREAYQGGDYARAESQLARALAEGADGYADVHHTLGVIYHTWGKFTKARSAFEEALKINPHYTEAALNLAITYNDMGRYAEAREIFERIQPRPEERIDSFTRGKIANLHSTVGDAYRSAGLSQEAAVEYKRALGLCPSFIDIRMNLAHSLSDHGAVAEAIEQVRLVLLERPDYLPAYVHLGLFLHRVGDNEGAQNAFKEVVRRDPGHERAGLYLRMLEPRNRSE